MTLPVGEEEPRGFHHPELDGLRFFAFLAVFLHHALPDDARAWTALGVSEGASRFLATLVQTGSLGVDFFLCLSAFLITTLLLRERDKFGDVSYKAFFARRALRIWPLYYAFLAFVIFVWPVFYPDEALSLRQVLAFATFASNWECGFHGYPTSVLAPLWSIALEEQFYLVWPLLLRLPRARMTQVLFGLVCASVAARGLLASAGGGSQLLWCSTFTRLDAIAFGALLALHLNGRAPEISRAERGLLYGVAMVAIASAATIVPLHRDPVTFGVMGSFLVMALACTAIVYATLRARADGLLVRPGLLYLGRISYGLYVFHMLGLRAARVGAAALGVSEGARIVLETALGLALTCVFASLSYRTLESPFLRLKAHFTRAGEARHGKSDADDRILQA
jgi:peptidoglycan/LPS O-acetylase OafA/YrhL